MLRLLQGQTASARRWCLLAPLIGLCILVVDDRATAQYSAPVYTGGTAVSNSGAGVPYEPYAAVGNNICPYQYGAVTVAKPINGNTCSDTGAIQTVFNWEGSTAPPQGSAAIMEQTAGVSYTYNTEITSGSDNNSLEGSNPGGAQEWVATKYTAISNPGESVTLPDPGLSSKDVNLAKYKSYVYAFVGYTASINYVTIALTGTTPDSAGNQDILVGQQCSASISGLPTFPAGTTITHQWTVSGTTFTNWVPGTNPDTTSYSYTGVPGSPNIPA